MGRIYQDELLELQATYQAVRQPAPSTMSAVEELCARATTRPAVFVGSGGTLALAELAALCSAQLGAVAARATTPLEVALGSRGVIARSELVLFSARARHPDVRLAARSARAQPGNFVTLATQMVEAEIQPNLRDAVDDIVVLPRTSKDGFLATNSLLAMAATWVASAGFTLPSQLDSLDSSPPEWPHEARRALIVYGPTHRSVAFDLEARLSETGMADVQLADYRNLAHGRHVGLLRRANETAVLYLEDPAIESLAQRTQSALPSSLWNLRLRTEFEGPVGSLDLLVSSMRLVGAIAERMELNPGAPKVGQAGRRLYHLPWAALAAKPDGTRPSRLKAIEAGASSGFRGDSIEWARAERDWRRSIDGNKVGALVMDHDGTCVVTGRRTEPPEAAVQREILRLLDAGVKIGFASGRGPSLMTELRRWIPKTVWPEVTVGLYNGAILTSLDQQIVRSTDLDENFAAAEAQLRQGLIGSGWEVEPRRHQITVERRGLSGEHVAAAVRSVLGQVSDLGLKVFASGHSVDVVAHGTSKRRVADAMVVGDGEVMVVGDQGQHLGNDFELLSSRTLSLSVDRVSADPSRCWNLSTDGTRGPQLLTRYLGALEVDEGAVRVRARRLGRAQ